MGRSDTCRQTFLEAANFKLSVDEDTEPTTECFCIGGLTCRQLILKLGASSWFWSIAAWMIFKIIIWCPLVDFPTLDNSRMKCLTLFTALTKISLKEGTSKSSHIWNCSCRKLIQSNTIFFPPAIISSANREGFFCQWVAQWRALLLKFLMVYTCTEKHTRGKEVWGCLALLCLSLQGCLKSEEQKSVFKEILND